MGTLLQDLRYAIRVLRKSPGFTVAAVLTLALAIGANAVVFSVMNALIIRPLNVPQPQSLYALWRADTSDAHQSYADYLDLRDRNRSFDDLAAFNISAAGIDTGKDSSVSWLYETSGTTSTHYACSRILAASSTAPTSMAQTARRISCFPTGIGTTIFRMIAAWWARWSS
jgi:hypothetical protein